MFFMSLFFCSYFFNIFDKTLIITFALPGKLLEGLKVFESCRSASAVTFLSSLEQLLLIWRVVSLRCNHCRTFVAAGGVFVTVWMSLKHREFRFCAPGILYLSMSVILGFSVLFIFFFLRNHLHSELKMTTLTDSNQIFFPNQIKLHDTEKLHNVVTTNPTSWKTFKKVCHAESEMDPKFSFSSLRWLITLVLLVLLPGNS